MIADRLARQGAWLFRWRSYVLLAFAPFFVLAVTRPEPVETYLGAGADFAFESLCIALAFVGLGVRMLTVGFVPEGTSGRNTRRQIAHTLNTTGLYSVTRNPLYLGNAITIMAVTMFTQDFYLTVAMGLFLVVYLERIIASEERFLHEKFGKAYVDWARTVPAFFPKFSGWESAPLPFSLRAVLRREHPTVLAIVSSLFVIDQVREWLTEPDQDVDIYWIAAFAAAAAAYLVLHWMKKRTRLLDVDGR